MNKEKLVILITGATSGIGLETYKILKSLGHIVYSISRHASDNENHIICDVTDEESAINSIDMVIRKEGHIDAIINAAGFGISGAIEFTGLEDAKRQMDVNFFGMVNINKAVIPYMRKRGRGRIVNISSVAGAIPIPFQAYYSATKAAINSYSMALANELRPYGVSVCAIQPGDIHTGFTAARVKTVNGDDEYQGRISKSVETMEHDELNGMDPKIPGKFISRVALKKKVKPIYTIGSSYKLCCLLIKILPSRLSNYIVYLIYAK